MPGCRARHTSQTARTPERCKPTTFQRVEQMKILVLATGALAVTLPLSVQAQDANESRFSAEVTIELQNDYTFDSSDTANELNDTFATIEGALSFALGPESSIHSTLVIEPITDPTGDRFFEDHGLYAEELFFSHNFENVEIVLGKFNPGFGVAWDTAPGIYGTDFAEDYELTERLGAGVNVSLGGDQHVFSVAVFQADRTILSDSLGKERGQTGLAAGGPSNTEGPQSYSFSLSGEVGDTGYNVGFQNQARGMGDAEDQLGYVAGLTHQFNSIELLGEVAYFEHFDGTTSSAVYTTVGAAVPVGPVTLSGVYSHRDIEGAPNDDLVTVSAEMELIDGLTGALGYRWADEGGEDTQTIGTLLVYEF
ncbi:MAG: hypothetical protein AAFW76_04390 [Pseudomonadota bacterium]